MLRILVFLALATAAAIGAVWLAERPGEVAIVWGGVTIETTVAVAAVAVLGLVLAGMLLWSALRFLLGLPTAFSFASRARRRQRGFDAVSRGMVAIGAGDPAAARRHAADARKLIADEPLTLLLSAQAAQLSGDKPAADAAFKDMLEEPATRVLGLRGLFVEARRRGDQVAARAFADEAVRLSPSLAWANDALLEFHSTAGEWAQARTAIERRAALRLSDKAESRRHRAVLLAAEALSKQAIDPGAALAATLDALKLDPGLTPAAALAGRMLAARGDTRKAARLIEAAWREQPHPDLAAAYVRLRAGDTARDRLDKALALMKLKPTDPESAFAVAEAAIEAREFGRAREALAPLVAAIPTVRACLLMARIEDGEHGPAGRAREWLTRSARAPRDNAWVADGVASESWMPVSPVSGRLGAFVWTLPPAMLGSAGPSLDGLDGALPEGSPASEALASMSAEAPPSASLSAPGEMTAAIPDPAPARAPAAPPEPEILPPPVAAVPARNSVAEAVLAAEPAPPPAAPMAKQEARTGEPRPTEARAMEARLAEGQSAPSPAVPSKVDLAEIARAPDDPGAPDPAPRKRSFWGFMKS